MCCFELLEYDRCLLCLDRRLLFLLDNLTSEAKRRLACRALCHRLLARDNDHRIGCVHARLLQPAQLPVYYLQGCLGLLADLLGGFVSLYCDGQQPRRLGELRGVQRVVEALLRHLQRHHTVLRPLLRHLDELDRDVGLLRRHSVLRPHNIQQLCRLDPPLPVVAREALIAGQQQHRHLVGRIEDVAHGHLEVILPHHLGDDRGLRLFERRLGLLGLDRRQPLPLLGVRALLRERRRVEPLVGRHPGEPVLLRLALRQHAGLDRLALPDLRVEQVARGLALVLLRVHHRLPHVGHHLLVVRPDRHLAVLQRPRAAQQLRALLPQAERRALQGCAGVGAALGLDLGRQHLLLRREHRRLRLVALPRQHPHRGVLVHVHHHLPPLALLDPRARLAQPPPHPTLVLLRRHLGRDLAQLLRHHRQGRGLAQRLLGLAALVGAVAQPLRRSAPRAPVHELRQPAVERPRVRRGPVVAARRRRLDDRRELSGQLDRRQGVPLLLGIRLGLRLGLPERTEQREPLVGIRPRPGHDRHRHAGTRWDRGPLPLLKSGARLAVYARRLRRRAHLREHRGTRTSARVECGKAAIGNVSMRADSALVYWI